MNNIRSTAKINARELELGGKGSWHDEFKESAYVYVGGLDPGLTEGDVITIFSQYGEPVDINLPRDKATSKPRGFGFLMYEDQRSTNLAVDNLNGAVVLGRTLRVDHTKNYKQLEQGEDGKMQERDAFQGESLNARPELHLPPPTGSDDDDDSDAESYGDIDPDDPMRSYLIEQRKKAKNEGGGKGRKEGKKRKHEGETKEERKQRKETKRLKKLLKEVGPSRRAGADQDDSEARRTREDDAVYRRPTRSDEDDRRPIRRSRSPRSRRDGDRDYHEGRRRDGDPGGRGDYGDRDDREERQRR